MTDSILNYNKQDMSDYIILSPAEFQKIFANAYAVVVNARQYDVCNDYELEDDNFCTVFIDIESSSVEYVIPREVEENSRVSYDTRYHMFYFEDQKDKGEGWIPPFKILSVTTIG